MDRIQHILINDNSMVQMGWRIRLARPCQLLLSRFDHPSAESGTVPQEGNTTNNRFPFPLNNNMPTPIIPNTNTTITINTNITNTINSNSGQFNLPRPIPHPLRETSQSPLTPSRPSSRLNSLTAATSLLEPHPIQTMGTTTGMGGMGIGMGMGVGVGMGMELVEGIARGETIAPPESVQGASVASNGSPANSIIFSTTKSSSSEDGYSISRTTTAMGMGPPAPKSAIPTTTTYPSPPSTQHRGMTDQARRLRRSHTTVRTNFENKTPAGTHSTPFFYRTISLAPGDLRNHRFSSSSTVITLPSQCNGISSISNNSR
jgi:hypothetical protein